MAKTLPANSVHLLNTHIHPAAKPAFDFFYKLKRRAPTVRKPFDGLVQAFVSPYDLTTLCVIHGIQAHYYARHSNEHVKFQLADASDYSDAKISTLAWRDLMMNLRWADMEHYTTDSLLTLIHDACPQDILNEAFIGGVNPALIRLMTGQLGRPTTYA